MKKIYLIGSVLVMNAMFCNMAIAEEGGKQKPHVQSVQIQLHGKVPVNNGSTISAEAEQSNVDESFDPNTEKFQPTEDHLNVHIPAGAVSPSLTLVSASNYKDHDNVAHGVDVKVNNKELSVGHPLDLSDLSGYNRNGDGNSTLTLSLQTTGKFSGNNSEDVRQTVMLSISASY